MDHSKFSTDFEKNYKYEKHSFKKDKTRPCNKGSIIQLLLIEDFKDIWACPWSFSCLCNKGTDVCSHKCLKAHTCTVHSRCYSTSSTCPSLQLYGTFPCTYLHNTLPIQNSIIYTLLTHKKKNRESCEHTYMISPLKVPWRCCSGEEQGQEGMQEIASSLFSVCVCVCVKSLYRSEECCPVGIFEKRATFMVGGSGTAVKWGRSVPLQYLACLLHG